MQKKLDSLLEHQLTVRVEISRTTGVFSTRELAEGFVMSLATLHRYISPEARELSRESARRQTNAIRMEREANQGKCYKCREKLDAHPRCVCEILLHGGAGHCGSTACIDMVMRSTVGASAYA